MEEQDRMSQVSSVVTVTSAKDKKLQSFCKRSGSIQRDPNSAVVIRGWLYKRDSSGLKLWKKRWFVLSNYCVFYYKDSREECVLGSLPLPSYKIFFCSPRECKNRKYAFKVVHQGMRSYFLSADTQEDMLGWVRALRQSACMGTDDLIDRRCSSYQDFSQIGGSTESVTPLHVYSHSTPSHTTRNADKKHRERHGTTYSRTRSVSLDRTSVDQFQCHGSGPSTPRGRYESRPQSPVGGADLRPQPDKEMHTLSALLADTYMVLTHLCGCDKVLQTLSVEMDLLQHDKEHAEFLLDMSRIDLMERLNEQHITQKYLLQNDLISIRAQMCDILQKMEKVWMDYSRMESELCVFRSHLQHICQFGLSQERCVAQKQIWMMDDVLRALKPNRRRVKMLMTSYTHTLKLFPLLHNTLHPQDRLPESCGGDESKPPARPPLPLEMESTNKRMGWGSEWAGPNDDASPVCLMHVVRTELPSALTAQRVCVKETNSEEETPNTLSYKHEEQSYNISRDLCMKSEQKHAKRRRVERIREPERKSALRRSDSAHPLKFIDSKGSECQRVDVRMTASDSTPSSANQISTLRINNILSEETEQSVSSSSPNNQRAEWFLSTNHWQGFIPLNIQEEELSAANQDSDTPTNQDSNQPSVMTSLVAMETLDEHSPLLSDTLSRQPITAPSDSHMVFRSDQSGGELYIYEETLCKAAEDYGSEGGGAKEQQSNLSANPNANALLANVGGLEEETGSDIMIKTELSHSLNSVSNDSVPKARVTVMRTSL